MMTRLLVLALLLPACGERVVYVYADAGPQLEADAPGAALEDAPAREDAAYPDGVCLPDRRAGEVSSSDCRRYPDRPVCDGWVDTCVGLPEHFCAACETDEQCQLGVDVRAECVFLPYAPGDNVYNDQACLSPCESDDDCAFLPLPEWFGVRCMTLPRGSYCVVPFNPTNDPPGPATCTDFHAGRRGDGA